MEDDLNFCYRKWKTTNKNVNMQDDLKYFENGRQPQKT